MLFTYNRLSHTKQTVRALQNNTLARKSELYIFSDGARERVDNKKIVQVRAYLYSIRGFKNIRIIERKTNFGLANNIISGVSSIVKKYDAVIVLEDDIVTSPYFLKYMNDALMYYKNIDKVACISGFVDPRLRLKDQFFLRGADCWGWATWKRGWKVFNPDGKELLRQLQQRRLLRNFDFNGTVYNSSMLNDWIAGKNNSWAIRWHASVFVENKLTLYPSKSLIRNIGHDGSGVNCVMDKDLQFQAVSNYPIKIHNIPLIASSIAVLEIRRIGMKIIVNRIEENIFEITHNCYLRLLHSVRNVRFLFNHGIKYLPIVNFQHIDGWLYNDQAYILYQLSSHLKNENPVVVELGSWMGKSSYVLARGLIHKPNATLYCIDPFNADGDIRSKKIYGINSNPLQAFILNMKTYHVDSKIRICQGYSYDYLQKINKNIDLIFIDANHSYNAVRADFLGWAPKVRSGGTIVFHDVDFNPWNTPNGREDEIGPGLVVKKYVINNKNYRGVTYTNGMFICIKK